MSLLNQISQNAQSVEERVLGPTYPYYSNIKTPQELGMGDRGTIQQMTKDIDGLIQYTELLVSGKSKASSTGGPLGNKFFLQTGGKCRAIDQCTDPNDKTTCESVNRYIYVNNVPEGNIPFISSGVGVNFTEFRGLIPGAMSNLNALNPMSLMRAFLSGATPDCQKITMETITTSNMKATETNYVTLADITDIDPCSFPDGINPVTKSKCRESFSTQTPAMSGDIVERAFFLSLLILGIWILIRFMHLPK